MTEVGEGTVLAGYRVERQLGRGGMGTVWLATQEALDRKVALKLLAPEISADPKFRARFLSESRLAASIDHPNIVPVFEAGEADGELFLAMRYVEGTDLDSLITTEGALAPGRVVGLLAGIADALDAAHARGLVHRDVKPSNILVAPGQRGEHAYLSDFGLTKRLGSSDALTRTGQVIGSVGYLAPEAIEGGSVDGRADIYSLGCVLYAALSGHPPYERDTDLAVLWAHVKAEPPTFAAERPTLAPLDPIITRALAKDPEARYATAGALMDAAAGALGLTFPAASGTAPNPSTDVGAAPASASDQPSTFTAGLRSRRSIGVIAAGLVAIVLVAAVLVQGGLLSDSAGLSPTASLGSAATDGGGPLGSPSPSANVTAGSGERILYELRAPRYFDAIKDCLADGSTPETIGRIWSVDPTTGEHVRVTGQTGLLEHQPVWSADGRRITFAASPPEFGVGLWQAASDGTGVARIVGTDDGPWSGPSIADDGRLAFVHGYDGIVTVANADGTNRLRVPLAFPIVGDAAKDQQLLPKRVTWLPDGRLAVVARSDPFADAVGPLPEATRGTIWLVDLDGTGLSQVEGPIDVIAADWSPDGTRIVYSAGSADDHTGDIWVADSDGSNPVQLTVADGDDVDPTWSPEGSRIAFASSRDGNYEIHVMNADGSDRRRLTSSPTPQFACAPSWGQTDAAPAPSPVPSAGAPLALERGWLAAGTYRSDVLRPRIDFTVGDGWALDVHAVDALDLYRPGLDLSIGLVQTVFPGGCLIDEQDEPAEGQLAPATARGLVEWFQATPGLKVSAPEAVTVGGEPGLRVDIEAVASPACHEGVGGLQNRIALFPLAGENSQLRVPGKARLVVIDVRGIPLTFLYQGEDRLFDSVLDPIVESITFPEE